MTTCVPAPPRVAVVLVNWNGWADCVECLDALFACDYPAFDVYLVDNASHDGSLEHIAAWCASPRAEAGWRDFDGVRRYSSGPAGPLSCRVHGTPPAQPIGAAGGAAQLHLIRAGGNLGFAAGNNIGMRAAGIDDYAYYWLLNTDTVVDRRALGRLVERAQADRGLGIVGSTLRYYSEPQRLQAMGGALMDPATTAFWCIGIGQPVSSVPADPRGVEDQMAYVVGASMLVSTAFVRDIGYMQEDYFLYFEEPDWACRGRQRFRLGYAPDSFVYHKVGASSAQVASLKSLNLLYRNRVRFMNRFLPELLDRTKRDMWRHMLNLARRLRFREALVVGRVLCDFRRLRASAEPAKH
jgi:GT2 family glycosyltransferase